MTGEGVIVIEALLASGAVSLADLQEAAERAASGIPTVPTHEAFMPVAVAACSPGSLRTYRTTWRRLVARFGDIPVDRVTTADLAAMAKEVRYAAAAERGGTGVGAEEGFIRGCRRWYELAFKQGYCRTNVAARVDYSKRNPRVRRALTSLEIEQIYQAVLDTSGDLDLDLLILDFHRETAARQGGATSLRVTDINLDRGSVLLREKGDTERETPCSRDVLNRILTHWKKRSPSATDATALRYRNGSPVTRRRYNTLFGKVQDALPWARRLLVSSHWIRHTTLTDVSRATNGRVAAAYAGHSTRSTTDIYTAVTFEELVIAHDLVFPSFAIGQAER